MKKKLITMILAAGAMLGAWAANVRVYVNVVPEAGWNPDRYFYAWSGTAQNFGAWPGIKVENAEVLNGETWHYMDIDATDEEFYLIFNDGESHCQTINVPIAPVKEGKRFFVRVSSEGETNAFSGRTTNYANIEFEKVQLWEGGPYWATTNIGAEEPWDPGYYFWWGDTVGYYRENNKWIASDGSSSNFSFSEANTPTYGKDAATLQSEGWITAGWDGILAPEHDAAHVQWGDKWRMPTYGEFEALKENCDREWITTNGVKGYVFRGRGDYSANSIFLPVTGIGTTTSFNSANSDGCYWSSVQLDIYSSFQIWFGSGFIDSDSYYCYRLHGQAVRPVQNAPATWASGDCTATLAVDGTLTVSGNGAMADYEPYYGRPWEAQKRAINSIVIEDGVTGIGQGVFYASPQLSSVKIPASVTAIVGEAFACCFALSSVEIPATVTSIGVQAFAWCPALTAVTIPASVATIGTGAFFECTAMTDVYCHPNAADLTWGDATQDFMYDGTTKIHVKTSQLAAYQKKFPTINATFVGDLPDFLGEDFERGVMPDGWTCESNDSNYLFSVGKGDYSDETGSHGGQYNAKLAHADWGVKSKLISPIVNLSDTTAPTLNFWFINRSWSGDNDELAVYYRTSSEAEWQLMTNFPSAHDSWTECAIALENPTATYQIAFECIYAYGYGIGIDDVSITDAGAEEEPVAPEVTATIAAIDAIGDVEDTDECKAKIDAARGAYDALTDAQKDQVTNYDTLTAAEAAYAAFGDGGEPPFDVTRPWTAKAKAVLNGAMYDAAGKVAGVAQLKVSKPKVDKRTGAKTVKVSGYLLPNGGKKVTLKSTTAVVSASAPAEVPVPAKQLGAFRVKFGDDGFLGAAGSYTAHTAAVGGKWTRADARVRVDFSGAA
ncbi:MAG: leucine-rich repeat protein, partial [Kiritimatiellae bacterium]|nr:leucine-rich repeat protein [Kiritimatiellia bacterium]